MSDLISNIIEDSFVESFKDYSECYTLIGGTASAIILRRGGEIARATVDYDLLLHEKSIHTDFYRRFVAYLIEGEYLITGEDASKCLYRFETRKDGYPRQIELLADRADFITDLSVFKRSISFDENHSLSAIMLDEGYHEFAVQNTEVIDDISILNGHGLIILKSRAWYNLFLSKKSNPDIKSTEVRKHISDVCRLIQVLEAHSRIEMDEKLRQDMLDFLELLEENLDQIPESKDYFYTREAVLDILKILLK